MACCDCKQEGYNERHCEERCHGCEDGCDSCIPPPARPGPFDTAVLLQHRVLLEQLITQRLDDLSKEHKCVYSLQKLEPSYWFIGADEGTIMIRRCPGRRDETEIAVSRLKNGNDRWEDSFFIRILRSGDVITWDNIMTLERCRGWCEFFGPIVKEWITMIRGKVHRLKGDTVSLHNV